MPEQRDEILPQQPADRRILTREPLNAEAAERAFAHLVTPTEMRFVRCHFDIPLLGDEHRLELAAAGGYQTRRSGQIVAELAPGR